MNPVIVTRTTSPSLISIMVVNFKCIVASSPALGKSYVTAGVALKDPTGAVRSIGRGLAGPDAAFVSIVYSEAFHRTPSCGITMPAD